MAMLILSALVERFSVSRLPIFKNNKVLSNMWIHVTFGAILWFKTILAWGYLYHKKSISKFGILIKAYNFIWAHKLLHEQPSFTFHIPLCKYYNLANIIPIREFLLKYSWIFYPNIEYIYRICIYLTMALFA